MSITVPWILEELYAFALQKNMWICFCFINVYAVFSVPNAWSSNIEGHKYFNSVHLNTEFFHCCVLCHSFYYSSLEIIPVLNLLLPGTESRVHAY